MKYARALSHPLFRQRRKPTPKYDRKADNLTVRADLSDFGMEVAADNKNGYTGFKMDSCSH